MQLRPDRPVHRLDDAPVRVTEILTPEQINRMGAVEVALVVCGAVSDDEVFMSDVLDVAAFIIGPEPTPDAIAGPDGAQ